MAPTTDSMLCKNAANVHPEGEPALDLIAAGTGFANKIETTPFVPADQLSYDLVSADKLPSIFP